MKKLILIALFAFGMSASAQIQTLKTVLGGTVTLDTVTNTETEYLYVKAPGATELSIQVVSTKISGSPNGKITWEVSHDGTNWFQLSANDSAHVSNVSGGQCAIYTLTPSPYLYYRVVALGRGTAVYQISATILTRKEY